jgi:hypothetical protein
MRHFCRGVGRGRGSRLWETLLHSCADGRFSNPWCEGAVLPSGMMNVLNDIYGDDAGTRNAVQHSTIAPGIGSIHRLRLFACLQVAERARDATVTMRASASAISQRQRFRRCSFERVTSRVHDALGRRFSLRRLW